MSLQTEGSKASPDTYLELFDFDARNLTGDPAAISYFTNTPIDSSQGGILWRGNTYNPLPFQLSGVEISGDSSAPNTPTIGISNVNKTLLVAVVKLGDLVGVIVTRWRTFYKFTDNGTTPNPNIHYPVDTWVITKKQLHTKTSIQFEMSHPLDRPGLMLPRKQILKDQGFPGVARVRGR